ncbi:unnamed protein product [Caenorhabditis brenneri]
MSETPEPSIYEKAFAKSDKTDAILVIGGKKMHVNKALLSIHSDYFSTLFNSEFKEKSMEEIEIKDVDFENFALLLSLVHPNRIEPKRNNVENLLVLADRFLLPSAKRYLELFIASTDMAATKKFCLADKFQLDTLMDHSLQMLDYNSRSTMSTHTIYEEAFAKSDKTDAILVVDGKKMHVNKAFLSFHSGYFNKLFNKEFKEKPLEEIPIKDVDFGEFATVLSLIQPNPLKPTEENAERLLKLADRFQLPAAKRHLELFLIGSNRTRFEKLRIADKYRLDDLFYHALMLYTSHTDFNGLRTNYNFICFSNETKMAPTKFMVVCGHVFTKSNKTDAILLVGREKFHVNKAFLSYHSDYFNALFNSEFKEKSMEKIEIKDVSPISFAFVLSLIYPNPLKPTEQNAEKLLELADRFLLPAAKRHLELFLIASEVTRSEKLRIADKYGLDDLFDRGLKMYTDQKDFDGIRDTPTFKNLSDANKAKVLNRLLDI